MIAKTITPLIPEGEKLLLRLFEIATHRLKERNIALSYSPLVIEWIFDQEDWQNCLNPLRTLDGIWHQHVANVIENLLIKRQLREGTPLTIRMNEDSRGIKFQFDADIPAEKNSSLG
jgi:hypothetical protein